MAIPYIHSASLMRPFEALSTIAARESIIAPILAELEDEEGGKKKKTHRLITGVRGAGKTHLLYVLGANVYASEELRDRWVPVSLLDESPSVTSLKDLLDLILLKTPGFAGSLPSSIPEARARLEQIARGEQKRILLLLDNFDAVAEELLAAEIGVLQSILANDGHLTVVATSGRPGESLLKHLKPVLKQLAPIELEPLSVAEMEELLEKRAAWEEREKEHRESYPVWKSKAVALTDFAGRIPLIILWLYEIFKSDPKTSVADAIQNLADFMTPIYREGLLDVISSHQRKCLDVLMKLGGRATPTDIAASIQWERNLVNAHLKRLKDAGHITPRKGTRGKFIYYTSTDPLFRIWYQIRFLENYRKRATALLELGRVWDSAEEIFTFLRSISSRPSAAAVETPSERPAGEGSARASNEGEEAEPLFLRFTLRDEYGPQRRTAPQDLESSEMGDGKENEGKAAGGAADKGSAHSKAGGLFSLAQAYHRLRQHKYETKSLKQALKYCPTFAKGWLQLGNLLFESDSHDRAVQCYDKAVEADPCYAAAWNNKGCVQVRKGDFIEALKCFQKAMEHEPDNPAAIYNMGNTQALNGGFREAADCYQKALRLDPENRQAKENLSAVYRALGQNERAEACMQREFRQRGQDAVGPYEKAANYFQGGKTEEALAVLADLIQAPGTARTGRVNREEAAFYYLYYALAAAGRCLAERNLGQAAGYLKQLSGYLGRTWEDAAVLKLVSFFVPPMAMGLTQFVVEATDLLGTADSPVIEELYRLIRVAASKKDKDEEIPTEFSPEEIVLIKKIEEAVAHERAAQAGLARL
jgi:tetratricopeptide (TPR) repeat protein